jgi:hypothetical protein
MPGYRCTVTADPSRNVIWMTQEGHAERDDMLRMRADYEAALKRVRPGFVLVNDQGAVQSFSDEALEVGKELVEMTTAAGASKVIRVVPGSLAQRSRISRVLVGGGFRYENVRVSTRDEAEALLREMESAAK